MFQAIANFFGLGDEPEEEVSAEKLRGPGLHKWEFVGRRGGGQRLEDTWLVLGELGRGAFGRVLAIKHRFTGRAAVCKLIPKGGSREQTMVRSEIELLRTLDHPNIVRMFEYYEDVNSFRIVFERIAGGDLQAEVRATRSGLDEKVCARYIRQVLLAVNYCHSLAHPVVHRDLKPANVMRIGAVHTSFCTPGISDIKIIDFGLGMIAQGEGILKRVCGTPVFMAPEVFDGSYGKEADIYAVGMMMYYLLTKELPFPTVPAEMSEFRKMLKTFQLNFPDRQGWNTRQLQSARDLIANMILPDSTARPTAAQALRSEYVTKHAPSPALGWRGYSRKLVTGLNGYAMAPQVLRVVLLVASSQVDQSDMGKMRRQFMEADADGDGFISKEELQGLLGRRAQKQPSAVDAATLMQVADIDGDGVVSFSEFVAAWLFGRLGSDASCVQHAFNLIDRDRDGLVTREDIFVTLNTRQLKQLGGSRRLAESVAEVFPAGQPMDAGAFTARLLQCEPVRLGLRFTRPRSRALVEDTCAPCFGVCQRSPSDPQKQGLGDLEWTHATAAEDLALLASSEDEDESSDSDFAEPFWQRMWR